MSIKASNSTALGPGVGSTGGEVIAADPSDEGITTEENLMNALVTVGVVWIMATHECLQED